jgi:hypothetical protein
MKKIKKIGFISLFFLFLAGCSSDSPLEPENQNPPANIKLSKFSNLQQNVLTNSCAVSGCHSLPNPRASLILTAGNAYGNLVNVSSIQMQSMLRVKPDDSNNSWLMKKLRAQGTTVMPPNGQLSVAVIDSIAKWIDQGAAND